MQDDPGCILYRIIIERLSLASKFVLLSIKKDLDCRGIKKYRSSFATSVALLQSVHFCAILKRILRGIK